MSTPANVAAEATGIDTGKAQENAVKAVDDHTPPAPDPEPPAENIPDPTDGDSEGRAELRDMVKSLATQVDALSQTVTALAKKDEPPVKRVPWTKRGGRK